VDNVTALRMAFRIARQERPFTIDAIVILPDHLHTIWTLPSGDSDFSGRWRRVKAYFTHRLVAVGVPVKRHRNGEYALWQRRFWKHTIRNEIDFERHVDYVHFNPSQAQAGESCARMALFVVSRLCQARFAASDWAGAVKEPTMDFGERRG
jgi:putative transposase